MVCKSLIGTVLGNCDIGSWIKGKCPRWIFPGDNCSSHISSWIDWIGEKNPFILTAVPSYVEIEARKPHQNSFWSYTIAGSKNHKLVYIRLYVNIYKLYFFRGESCIIARIIRWRISLRRLISDLISLIKLITDFIDVHHCEPVMFNRP